MFFYNEKIQFLAGFYKIHEVEFELDLNFVSIFTHHADLMLTKVTNFSADISECKQNLVTTSEIFEFFQSFVKFRFQAKKVLVKIFYEWLSIFEKPFADVS